MQSYDTYKSTVSANCRQSEYLIGKNRFSTIFEDLPTNIIIRLVSDAPDLVLHWGVSLSKSKQWNSPLAISGITLPPATQTFDNKAAETPFTTISPGLSIITIEFSKPPQVTTLDFVLRQGNTWHNNNSTDYSLQIKELEIDLELKYLPPDLQNAVLRIIDAETSGGPWTLMHRFNLCNSLISNLSSNTEALSYLFIWMRFSALRKLDWQRNHNTRPIELASSQKNLTFTLSNSLRPQNSFGLINNLTFLRGILSTIGKASENGQRIRDEILQILHRGKVRTHKPEIDKSNYYEQWHQKLHNNTTPDDIGICEAVIAYNETRSMQKYWEVLTNHGITKERLCSYERPIVVEPFLAPQIVGDLYGYLELLKAVHGSVELSQCIDICRGFVGQNLSEKLQEVRSGLSHWDKILQMEKALDARKMIKDSAGLNDWKYREIVYLDIALEGYIRKMCEEIAHIDISAEHLCRELRVVIENVMITANSEEFDAAFQDYKAFTTDFNEKSKGSLEKVLIVKSSCDRLQRLLMTYVDLYTELLDSKAKYLGGKFLIDEETLSMFTEECIRGSLFFAVSIILKKLDKSLRRLFNLKPWQIISPQSPIQGIIVPVKSLSSVAYTIYDTPTILICSSVTGEEEIPENVVGVICSNELDTLAHVSVRARNSKTLLAVCYNEEDHERISKLKGKVRMVVINGEVVVKDAERTEIVRVESERKEIRLPLSLNRIILQMEEFEDGRTGAKANNCAELRRRLPEHIRVPRSAALPYGCYEYILSLPENDSIQQKISSLLLSLTKDSTSQEKLNEIRREILLLTLPPSDESLIKSSLQSFNLPDCKWPSAWTTIKKVWASKYNERVLLSTIKSKIDLQQISMSVLCQEVISGDYAFVLHTKNPQNNSNEEIYGEIVKGLGETLVGAYAGRSLAFVVNKHNQDVNIESFVNKSVFLTGGGVIFRSDSNSEDLPGFAGAGLFDSFIMDDTASYTAKYSEDKLVNNPGYRQFLIMQLKEVGIMIEEIFCGVPQDIEGVVKDSQIYVVQSRPQV